MEVVKAHNHQEVPLLNAVTLPILMKAVDFLFDQGAKILDEIRNRRESSASNSTGVGEPGPAGTSYSDVASKEEVLNSQVDEATWRAKSSDVENLLRLADIYRKNYEHARQGYAKYGSALAPPILVHNLDEAEANLEEVTKRLQGLVQELTGQSVQL